MAKVFSCTFSKESSQSKDSVSNEKAKIARNWRTQRNYEPQEELHYAVAAKNVSDSFLEHGNTAAKSQNSIKMSPQMQMQMSSLMKFALYLNDSLKNSI
jgi:hypothetical protein